MKFSIKGFFRYMTRPQFSADLVTFTEETRNGNLHSLSSTTTLRCSQDPCKHLRWGAFNCLPLLQSSPS